MSRLLNLGCGSTFHPERVNLDADPASAGVIAHNVRRGLPFDAKRFDGVYGSRVLEHLTPIAGARLLRECRRILRPDGIVRLVVPDLEKIARLYLQSLERAIAGDAEATARYEWAMLELYDQTVRTKSGGAMGVYLRGALDPRQKAFITSRIGDEITPPRIARPSVGQQMVRTVAAVRRMLAGAAAYLVLGAEGRAALREGLFRRGGEVHQWMYDRYFLRCALENAGFIDVRACAADESHIPGFKRYGLETTEGRARKPDSLYMEARKPGNR